MGDRHSAGQSSPEMTSLFNLIVDDYQILDAENRPVEDIYTQSLIWLDNPGCLLQPGSFDLPAELQRASILPGVSRHEARQLNLFESMSSARSGEL